MADSLVHVAIEVRRKSIGERRWGVEIRKSYDCMVVGEAVEEGKERVFAAGDKGDDIEGGSHRSWWSVD